MPYNEPATLPTSSTPIDPPILTSGLGGNYGVNNAGSSLDFFTRIDPGMGYVSPSIQINPGAYPAPGTQQYGGLDSAGNTASGAVDVPGLISRLFNHTPGGFIYNMATRNYDRIPAVRIAKTIGNLFAPRPQPWQQNAQPNAGSLQGPPAIPPGGALFGYRPSEGGGLQHYDPGTGRVTTTPATNPLYTTGGAFQPIGAAPQDVRFAQNSGTGNFVADQTTKNFLAGGGYQGAPNQAGPDSANRFYGRARSVDSEGGYSPGEVTQPYDPAAQAAKRALYQEAIKANPYQQGEGANYTKRINDWIAQRNGSQSIETLLGQLFPNGTGTISGPPPLPIGIGG